MNHAPQLTTAATNDPKGALVLATGSAAEADARLDLFVRQHCICRNCFWVVARPAHGVVICKHPEGALIDGIPHVDTTTCECNDLDDLVLASDLQTLMEGLFALPNVASETRRGQALEPKDGQ